MRRLVEEQQADVLGKAHLGRPADDVEAPGQRFGRKLRLLRQFAAHVPQKLLDQQIGQVRQRRRLMIAVVERHRGGQGQQLPLVGASGAHRAAVPANVVGPLRPAARQIDPGLVGTRFPAGHP